MSLSANPVIWLKSRMVKLGSGGRDGKQNCMRKQLQIVKFLSWLKLERNLNSQWLHSISIPYISTIFVKFLVDWKEFGSTTHELVLLDSGWLKSRSRCSARLFANRFVGIKWFSDCLKTSLILSKVILKVGTVKNVFDFIDGDIIADYFPSKEPIAMVN